MFTQTNEEFYDDMYNDGNENDVEEYVLQNFRRRNGTRQIIDSEETIDSDDELMEFDVIIAQNPLPNSYQERLSIVVPRGTTEVTKSRLLNIRQDLARRSIAVREKTDQAAAIPHMSSTNLEELEITKRRLDNLKTLIDNQAREYEEQLQQYRKALEEVNTRETFYRNELHKSQDAHRADANFWQNQKSLMETELQTAKLEFERERNDFMMEWSSVHKHLEELQRALQRERDRNEEMYTNFQVALDAERQKSQNELQLQREQSERALQMQHEVIENQQQQLVTQDAIMREQENEIIENENAIYSLHDQMYEMGERMNENEGTRFVEEGGSFMTRNWLQISGYRLDIGGPKEIVWNAASKTALGRHYKDARLEASYWVNWVQSNLVDQLALKHKILERKGVGYKGYVTHKDRPDVISGKTAYNAIMQYNDLMVRILNATQKAINKQKLTKQEAEALTKANAIYYDPATQSDNIPTLLKNVKRTYEAYMSKQLPIEDNFRALMYFICYRHKSKSKSHQV